MDLKKFKEKIGKEIEDKEISIDTTHTLEDIFFNDKESKEDYRNRTIDFSIRHRMSFGITANNGFNLLKRFVKIKCPVCNEEMELTYGSGNNIVTTGVYKCKKCKVENSISIPHHNGFSFIFRE